MGIQDRKIEKNKGNMSGKEREIKVKRCANKGRRTKGGETISWGGGRVAFRPMTQKQAFL